MDPVSARARLDAERQRLEETGRAARDLVGGAGAAAADEPAGGEKHPTDQGSETFERERDSSVLQRVEAQLAEIDAAAARLDAGSYGLCELCGKPIGDARLEAMPATRYCVDDQARMASRGRSVTTP